MGKILLRYSKNYKICIPISKYYIYSRYEEPWWPSENFEGFAFLHKNPSDFTEEDAVKDWTRNTLGLYAIAHRPNVLLMWVTGAAMRHVETLSDEVVKFDVERIINQFLSKDYPNIPQPEEIMVCIPCCLNTVCNGHNFFYPLSCCLGDPLVFRSTH